MNAIYQFWSGEVPHYATVSSRHMKKYANDIGADYVVNYNKNVIKEKFSEYYNCFAPLFDNSFDKYENVLFCDMDVFPVDGLLKNIFLESVDKFGIVAEERKIKIRYNRTSGSITGKNDERWASKLKQELGLVLPRNNENQLRIFNSGVVLYTREGIEFARKNWQSIKQYQDTIKELPTFYKLDQNYLGAMLSHSTFTVLDDIWNSPVYWEGNNTNRHVHDGRTNNTNFVHIQLRGRDKLDDNRIYDITNKPINEWRHL
jgi:hypothetical protein